MCTQIDIMPTQTLPPAPLNDYVSFSSPLWDEAAIMPLTTQAHHVINACLCPLFSGPWVCGVQFADNATVQELNTTYRDKPKPTNVLSFPSGLTTVDEDDSVYIGDIILAYETCATEAKEQSKSVTAHVQHLLIHGMLHLMDFNHLTSAEAETMENIEIRLLEHLNITNPYA